MKDFVRVQGNQFVVNGKPLMLRGLGVGSWLNLEHFMLGVPGWDGQIRKCFDAHCPSFMQRFTDVFFTLEDALYIKSLGLNFIRVPINHHLFWDDETDTKREYGIKQLQRLADICEKSGLYFLPDLHTTPGGQNPDWHSESPMGSAQFWSYKAFQNRAVELWKDIACALKSSPALLGYDLLNEPVLPKGRIGLLNDFYQNAAVAIRTVDKQHILFLEGDRFSMDFSSIRPLLDEQCAYAYHFYPGVWDERLLSPGMGEKERGAAFAAALDDILHTMGDYRGPLLCGEMGYELSCLDAEFGVRLTETTMKAIEAQQSGWCLWCYKDARFMGLVYPHAAGEWMRLVKEIRASWDHHRAANVGQLAVDAIEKLCPYDLTPQEKYTMQFVIRAAIAKEDASHILSPALNTLGPQVKAQLADDFALGNCERNLGLEKLLLNICTG